MLQKQEKKPSLKQTEQYELNIVSNMTAKIDINAVKNFTKSRTNETEYWQKIKKQPVSTQDYYQF